MYNYYASLKKEKEQKKLQITEEKERRANEKRRGKSLKYQNNQK
jgi:hypothetical protein